MYSPIPVVLGVIFERRFFFFLPDLKYTKKKALKLFNLLKVLAVWNGELTLYILNEIEIKLWIHSV